MSQTTNERVSFPDSETRHDEMHSTIEMWIEDLTDEVDTARGSTHFQNWLDVQSRFHDYSHRNTLLIQRQYPDATKVAGYRTWQDEFDRQVSESESAIWIWAPIITTRCPECQNSPSYHEQSDCDYDETPPAEWDRGLVGFQPAPVFDISQTEGEPLPDLDTAAQGNPAGLVDALLASADAFDFEVSVVAEREWSHGDARGVCSQPPDEDHQLVEARERDNPADLAVTLV